MQNTQIEKAIPWNPWHGCKKVSPGCKNCFVYKMDKRYGRDTTVSYTHLDVYKRQQWDFDNLTVNIQQLFCFYLLQAKVQLLAYHLDGTKYH